MATKTPFGAMPDGTAVDLVQLKKGPMSCQVITYGGALRALSVPDRSGHAVDVVLGFDTLEDYLRQDKYIGALIGRFANRVGGARFSLDGVEYALPANDGPNHLHGGPEGFDKQVWTIEALSAASVTLSLVSPDGQAGYPGALAVRVTYRLTGHALEIDYAAKSDAPTLCSLTNHSYFNLDGHGSGPVGRQHISLPAALYTPTDAQSIPTGEIASVAGTPMDLRQGIPMGRGWDRAFPQLRQAGGYDHNWLVPGPIGSLRPAALAWSDKTGVALEVLTTQSGVQFYTGNYLDGCPAGKGGAPYAKRWGFCLETQSFPDAPNQPHFPSAVLPKGRPYRQKTVYRFFVR